jgi:hypothetical protein
MTALPPQRNVIPYAFKEHGTDILLIWYLHLYQLREHEDIWGDILGSSPSRFIAAAVDWELVFVVDETQDWQRGDGLLAAAWGDDMLLPISQRLHFWATPMARRAACTDLLAFDLLSYFFDRYRVLYGLTPVSKPHILRAWKRWGFTRTGTLPEGAAGNQGIDAALATQTRTDWIARQVERHSYERWDNERP